METMISKPKYVQLADQLRRRIQEGELKVGDRLPSYAEMHRQFGAATATVQRIYDLLEEENLVERRVGSGLYVTDKEGPRTGNIGLIFSRGYQQMHDSLATRLARGIYDVADLYEQQIIFIGSDRDWNPNAFSSVDGLLLSGHYPATNAAILRHKPAHMPCVSLFNIAKGMTSVVVDDYGAARIAMDYLYHRGHRRIACLMSDLHKEQIVRNRVAGYRDFWRDAEIENDLRWERLRSRKVDHVECPSFLEWGRREMGKWIEEDWQSLHCSALLMQNDTAAIGAMQTLQEAGYDVPGDVSIMGFDGTELCDHVTPHLTSMQFPIENIGRKGVELLLSQVERRVCEEQVVMLPVMVREGDSVRSL